MIGKKRYQVIIKNRDTGEKKIYERCFDCESFAFRFGFEQIEEQYPSELWEIDRVMKMKEKECS